MIKGMNLVSWNIKMAIIIEDNGEVIKRRALVSMIKSIHEQQSFLFWVARIQEKVPFAKS